MRIAIVRVRGSIRLNCQIKDALDMLGLYKQNYCTIFDDSPTMRGNLRKIKDQVSWGEIDEETEKLLQEKRKPGKKGSFRLNPPKGGFEPKGTKKSFKEGGALGYRGKAINDLIKRMIG